MDRYLKSLIYLGLKRAKGSKAHQHFKWFYNHQYRAFDDLQRERQKLLTQLLKEAFAHVPGYNKRMLESGVYSTFGLNVSDFESLPMLTREDLSRRGNEFVHQQAHERGIIYYPTGGSTGAPVKIGQDPYYRDWAQATTWLFHHWHGLSLGKPYFLLWAAYRDLEAQLQNWKSSFLVGYLQGRRILNCKVTSPELLSTFIHKINAERDCHHLVGYANEIYTLACHSLEVGLPLQRPLKAIFTTAETLTEEMRQVIESVFHCQVYNRYGCRDAGDIACECEFHRGLHINPLSTLIEVVDDEGCPVPDGQEGQILITSLHNYAMPLIRYAVGDRGILNGAQPCACGREWETLVKITGRTNEKLYLRSGSRFGGGFLYTAFEALPSLKRFQIHQLSFDALHIKLRSVEPDYLEKYSSLLEQISSKLCAWADYPLQITFEQTDQLDRTPTGKELLIIHHLDISKVDEKYPPMEERTLISA
jgi:phenylacetate-CoA ligase